MISNAMDGAKSSALVKLHLPPLQPPPAGGGHPLCEIAVADLYSPSPPITGSFGVLLGILHLFETENPLRSPPPPGSGR